MTSKQDIIHKIYFDKSGFASKQVTLKDAKEKDKSITMKDVEDFFKKNVEDKKKPRGFNSFVAPSNNHTYQIDLFFMGKEDFENKQKFRVGLVAIDVLSKYAVVVPIRSRESPDVIAGVMEALNKMKKKPQIIYTDDERAIAGEDFKEYVESEGIQLYRTRNHPAFAERFVRTFKDMLFKRVENDEKKGKQNLQWVDYILEIMLTYNDKMVHSATNMKPKDAMKNENELKARVNVAMKARKDRIYPEVSVGDKVRIIRKKAITEKERSSHFLKGEYTVEEIFKKMGQTYFKMTDYPRPLMRSDIVKV